MKRRIFTREFKLSLLQELDRKSAAQVCREHEIHPVLLSTWKKEFDRDPVNAFRGHGNAKKEEDEIALLERTIGRLYSENELLKKNLELQQMKRAEEKRLLK